MSGSLSEAVQEASPPEQVCLLTVPWGICEVLSAGLCPLVQAPSPLQAATQWFPCAQATLELLWPVTDLVTRPSFSIPGPAPWIKTTHSWSGRPCPEPVVNPLAAPSLPTEYQFVGALREGVSA